MSQEALQRMAVVAQAKTWVGTPYHHEARVKGAGVDCAMLLAEVYEAAGLIPHTVPPHYPPDWHLHRSEERYLNFITKYAQPLAEDAPRLPGDVVTYKFGRCISHAAIVIDWPLVIHAVKPLGVIVDHGDSKFWATRFAGAWTLWGTP